MPARCRDVAVIRDFREDGAVGRLCSLQKGQQSGKIMKKDHGGAVGVKKSLWVYRYIPSGRIYLYIYVHMYIIYKYVYIYIYIYIRIYIYIHIYIYVYICMYVCMYVCIYIYVCMYVCMYIYIY